MPQDDRNNPMQNPIPEMEASLQGLQMKGEAEAAQAEEQQQQGQEPGQESGRQGGTRQAQQNLPRRTDARTGQPQAGPRGGQNRAPAMQTPPSPGGQMASQAARKKGMSIGKKVAIGAGLSAGGLLGLTSLFGS